MKSKLFCLLLVITGWGCRHKTDDAIRLNGAEYYNNKTGSWVIYHVDSIVFDDFLAPLQDIDTYVYQVKEMITEKFSDASGNETNRIERFKRMNDTLPWVLTNVWTSNLRNSSLEKVEENIRYVKMIFPIAAGKFWGGNKYNTQAPWDYCYTGIKEPVVLNGHTFDNTVTVLQRDSSEDNFIEKRFAREIYALNIGMVYKQIDTLEVQNSVKKGLYYRQTAIDWSK
jgi:hypothetical protein